MVRWRRMVRAVNVLVVLVLLARLTSEPSGAVFTAAHLPLPGAPPLAARLAPAAPAAPASAATPAGPSDVQTQLNRLVRQALIANGWTVTALTSQLAPAAEASSAQELGTGQWQAALLDENQQPLALAGTLGYSLTVEAQGNRLSSASLALRGTLASADVTLALDLSGTVQNDGAVASSTSEIALELVRAGKTSTTAIYSSGTAQALAYNLVEWVTHSTLERDGERAESTQTLTARQLGEGESELWLQVEASGTSAALTGVDQHLFQRVSGAQVSQYLDRFDLTTRDNSYSLQAPAAITGTLDGELHYAMTLVDANGVTLDLVAGQAPRGGPLSGGKVPGLAKWLPALAGRAAGAPPGDVLSSVAGAARPAGSQRPPALSACDLKAIGLLAVGVLAFAAGGGLITLVIIAEVIGSTATFILIETVALSAFGGLSLGEALANLLSGCNADPYFVAPDSRPLADAIEPAPVQITQVTGGLLAPATAPVSPTASTAAAGGQTAPNVEYRDSAQIFAGGGLPHGATAIGSWAWDNARLFRAAPSHTQPRGDGSQLHYFIHAAQPLTPGADDDIIPYVYLDPQTPPEEIYLQFYIDDGDGEHRAYWGTDRVQTGGRAGTASLYPMGALPATGAWVRLRIPADQLGLAGQPINGVLYGAYGGQTWWGPTTTSSRLTDTAPDQLVLDEDLAPPATQPGALIAFRLSEALPLTIEIVDGAGARVRTLARDELRQPVYQVVVWDAQDDRGTAVPDRPYRVRIRAGGETVAEAPLTISPFVADILSPGAFSVVRGIDVPIFGEAYGDAFDHYVVEYGAGLAPTAWETLVESGTPRLLPGGQTLAHIRAGNLANWNVGLDEFTPWQDKGLAGVYTLRLRVIGRDGREASDRFSVLVGRLVTFAEGGTIASPDGRARLIVPPLAVQNGFALLALVRPEDVTADERWRELLPGDKSLAGGVYEIFPADERFRQDVVLELPYEPGSPAERLGVLIDDGTPGGWRYLGGTVDPARHTIRVSTREFGGRRALVAPFVATDFGPPDPFSPPAEPLAVDPAGAAPAVAAGDVPFAFYSDLQASAGEWAPLDVAGTGLARVQGAAAGLAPGGAALQVTRLAGGVRLVRVRATPYDALRYPILSFDYRIPPGYAPDLLLRSQGAWWQVRMGSDLLLSRDFRTLFAPALIADDAWHHYQIDVLALLRAQLPEASRLQIDAIALGQVRAIGYRRFVPVDGGAAGSAYYVTNFAALAPVNTTSLAFTLAPPAGARAFAFSLDQTPDGTPALGSPGTTESIRGELPAGAPDGGWYLHLRAQAANGAWGATGHFPLLIDRQPPQLGEPAPPPDGAGSPDVIRIPVTDASGVDPGALRVQLNGRRYGLGSGVVYNAEQQALQITPAQLTPALPFIASGQIVELAVSGLRDYAGNQQSRPFAWSFTADRTSVQSEAFRQLTSNGGEDPALSPDGSLVAFVSSRSGTARIWVMRADDFGESAGSARLLSAGSPHEADPTWSPGGRLIAFVSDASGPTQIWVAAPDGGGARALTAGPGTAASPTWSPDGRALAFVRDGNLWQVNADGSGAHALTSYPERPFRAVRWQPGGSLLAVEFELYQQTIDLYDPATGALHPLTAGGREREPEWLNPSILLYTAPAAAGQPDAIWGIGLDASGAALLAGSGQPGVSDRQAAGAADGSALALVSTRAGAPNVWLQANRQIAKLEVLPAAGVPAGTPLQIWYSLPVDAAVTLEIVGVRSLLDGVQQAKGFQTIAWDGAAANGRPLSPGVYAIKLTAQPSGGAALERYATARLLDAAEIGTLQLQVNQWGDVRLQNARDLTVQVYPHGVRAAPAGEASELAEPSFNLPQGEYDVVLLQAGVRREFAGIQVAAGQTTTRALDLQFGGLGLTVLLAPGRPVNDSVYLAVTRSDDPLRAPVAEQYTSAPNVVLPAGRYDLVAEYRGLRRVVYGVTVTSALETEREITLGAGTLELVVLGFRGQPADPTGRLIAAVYDPRDHVHALASGFGNPLSLLVPAGRYDVRIEYGVGLSPPSGGATVAWLRGVEVRAGQATAQTFDLQLGELKLDILEAAGRPAEAANLVFYLTPVGDPATRSATVALLNTATLQLAPGSYEVIADYAGTGLLRAGPVATVQVKEGESLAQSIDLKLARLRVEVYDAPGRLSAVAASAWAYPAGTRADSFAAVYGQNPLELIVRAESAYDVVVRLDGKELVLEGVALGEGATQVRQVQAGDFK